MANEVNLTSQVSKYPSIKDNNKIKSFSKGLLFHLFSFIEQSDLALFFSTCHVFVSLQQQYNEELKKYRYASWKRIINSEPRMVSFDHIEGLYRLVNNHFFWSADGKRFFMDLTNLLITSNEVEYPIPYSSGGFHEKITVSRSRDNTWIIFDTENRRQLYKINLNKYLVVDILGTKIKGQTIEFVTTLGDILQFDLNKFAKEEGDKKEIEAERLNIISCIPKEFQNSDSLSNLIRSAFKVKKTYYFQWKTLVDFKECQPVIAMEDIRFPDQRTILEQNSELCKEDDQFFYIAIKNVITIYKGQTKWKKIILENIVEDIDMDPTDYGLVVEFQSESNDTHISFWDHKNYDLNPETTPIFKKVFENVRLNRFVRDDLFIYEEDKKWKVFHLPQREEIGILPVKDIGDIVTSNNPFPKYFIVHCEGESYNKKPSSDFLIFSEKNNSLDSQNKEDIS